MAANSHHVSGIHHHLSLYWGNIMMALLVFLGASVPALILLLLGFDPAWAACAMVAGGLTIWGLALIYFRLAAARRMNVNAKIPTL
jgi:hypothetical protein